MDETGSITIINISNPDLRAAISALQPNNPQIGECAVYLIFWPTCTKPTSAANLKQKAVLQQPVRRCADYRSYRLRTWLRRCRGEAAESYSVMPHALPAASAQNCTPINRNCSVCPPIHSR